MKLLFFLFVLGYAKVQWTENNPDHEQVLSFKSNAHPAPRGGHAAFCYMEDLYIFGGHGANGRLRDFWTYQADTDRWLWLTDGPGPQGRSHMCYWVMDGKFWVYGGETQAVGIMDDFWMYTPSTRQWNPQTNQNGPSKRLSATCWGDPQNGRLYLYGGKSDSGVESGLWHYDVQTHSWHAHPESEQPGPLMQGAAAQIEDTLYLFGGATDASETQVSSHLWKLDLNTLIWTEMEAPQGAAWPKGRSQHTLFSGPHKNTLVLINGKHGSTVLSDMWILDLETGEWDTSSSNAPSKRYGSAYCIDGEGTLVLNGGAYTTQSFSNDVWQYGDRSTFAALQEIFKFDLNYTNVALSYVVAMVTLLMCFAIAFSIVACVRVFKRKREKQRMPIQPVEDF